MLGVGIRPAILVKFIGLTLMVGARVARGGITLAKFFDILLAVGCLAVGVSGLLGWTVWGWIPWTPDTESKPSRLDILRHISHTQRRLGKLIILIKNGTEKRNLSVILFQFRTF